MDRRKSLKALAVGTLSAGVLLNACKDEDKKATEAKDGAAVKEGSDTDRQPEEIARYKELTSKTFYS